MYSIINSTNHYYNPETIQIKITQDNKCIIQSIINNQKNHSNNNFNLSPNILNKAKSPILNKNLNNSPANNNIIFKNNDKNLINTNSLNKIKNNNGQNYLNNMNNEEDDIDIINNNGEDNLLISFSNISELTKNNMNNNSVIEKDPKDNLKTPSVCNYLEFTPTPNNNRKNDNNLLKINNNTYNNEIKKRNLNYIFNILNSDNKSITKKPYYNKIVDDNYLSYSNSINNISSINLRNSNKKEKKKFVIETMKNINIINKSNEKMNLNNQNYKIDNVKNIQIINNKTQKENKDINLNNNNEKLDLYQTMTKHLSNFSFGINNFNIITNPISNIKNNSGNNNINSDENNIFLDNIEDANNNNLNNNSYHSIEKNININITNNPNDINILEDNNNYFSPKFNIINNINNNNNNGQLGKEKEYKIYHLDLSEINNKINNTKNNNIINKETYNNLQLTDGFPSFSIIDKKNKTKKYIKKKYTGTVNDKEKMRINPKDKYINTNYINNTNSNVKILNSVKRISNSNEKQKDFNYNYNTTNSNYVKMTVLNGSRNKINKNIKKINFLSNKNIFTNKEDIPSNINKDKKDSYNGNLSFNKAQNKRRNILRKNNSSQKYQNTIQTGNKNSKNHNTIDQNLKERIQSILEKKLNLILSKNIANNKKYDIHSISEKNLNSKKNNTANNEIIYVNTYGNNSNKSSNSYNGDAISTSNNSNSNKKSYSANHLNNNKKNKFNSKPSTLVKKNSKYKKINSKIVFNKNTPTLKKIIYTTKEKEKEENKTKNYIYKKDIKFQNNNNNKMDDLFYHINYNNNSKKTIKECNNNNEIHLNKFMPMKTRIDEAFQKTYIIEDKDINILNLGSADTSKEIKIYNGKDDEINNMNGIYGDNNFYYKINSQNAEIDSNDETVNYMNNDNIFTINNKSNLTTTNNFVKIQKKPLVIIQNFSKYKKKNIAN